MVKRKGSRVQEKRKKGDQTMEGMKSTKNDSIFPWPLAAAYWPLLSSVVSPTLLYIWFVIARNPPKADDEAIPDVHPLPTPSRGREGWGGRLLHFVRNDDLQHDVLSLSYVKRFMIHYTRPLVPGSFILSLAIFLLASGLWPLVPVSSALSADWQWSVNISVPYVTAEGGKASQTVTAGARLTALDQFDNTWDTVAVGSTILSSYFYHPEYAPADQFLARDFRFDSYPKQWDLFVASDQDGQPITLAWSLPPTSMGSCLGLTLSLTDATTGAPVDLTQPTYLYTNNAAVTRHFVLNATQVITTPPSAPLSLFSPRTGTASVLLAWSGVTDPSVVGYHVYRKDPGATEYRRVTATPTPVAKYLDTGLNPGAYSYLVTAVTSTGCESSPSNALSVTVGP
jgi:hypothetical protein